MSKKEKKEKAKSKTGINKELKLSMPLRIVVGVPRASRGEVMKLLWAYIKKNDLQSPKDMRTILCDKNLQRLFKVEKIGMMQMPGKLKEHFVADIAE